ncbi:hypothetical protein DL897_16865 [Thermoflavimicrobium daqui]|uniref:Uncharacterized protein n=2 Tax=Thermoflavimicrobium daqui TaxID=2137476 RepID=A0A364K0T7_9BACL|nr:hypothetical protein DL897_16865 [Thermoflavimicrobium daqui]
MVVSTIALTFLLGLNGEAFAARHGVHLSGSGPVYTGWFSPGSRTVTVSVETHNNLNVGFDLFDNHGNAIANGTIKDKGKRVVKASTHRGNSYRLRLRCQEPRWNMTKCRAYGEVSW